MVPPSRSTQSQASPSNFAAAEAGGQKQRDDGIGLDIAVIGGGRKQLCDLVGGEGAYRLLGRRGRGGILGRVLSDQFPFAGLFERGVQHAVDVQHRAGFERPRFAFALRPWSGRHRAATRKQRRIGRIEIGRREFRQRDVADLALGEPDIAAVTIQGRRRMLATLFKQVKPAVQEFGGGLPVGVTDAAALNLLLDLCRVRLRLCVPCVREVFGPLAVFSVEPRLAPRLCQITRPFGLIFFRMLATSGLLVGVETGGSA